MRPATAALVGLAMLLPRPAHGQVPADSLGAGEAGGGLSLGVRVRVRGR